MNNLDFLWRLNEFINSLGLYANSNVGNLMDTESISVTALPGGITQKFYDGIRDQDYNISFVTKSKQQQNCVSALNAIQYSLLTINDLPSGNGSYVFDSFVSDTPPNFVVKDEQGWFIYELSATAKLTINKGVV